MIPGIMARRIASAAATATWSPLTKYQSAPTVLSGSNLILTANTGASGTYANAVSSRVVQDLGYYSGVVEATGGENAGLGVVSVPQPVSSASFPQNSNGWAGSGQSGAIWANTGFMYTGTASGVSGSSGTSIAVEMAVRLTPPVSGTAMARCWIRQSGGAWYRGGDPVADTTPSFIIAYNVPGATIAVGASIARSGATSARRAILHGDAASTTGTPPVGFTKALWGAELT